MRGPNDYELPGFVRVLVSQEDLEEMPFDDGCPSYCAVIRDCRGKKLWLRIFIEHVEEAHRRFWPQRFTVLLQPDLMVLFGRRVISTDNEDEARRRLKDLLSGRAKRFRQDRFKVLPSGGA